MNTKPEQKVTMKPMIILAPNIMEEKDIEMLRSNNLCVVVAKDPHKVRFVDPLPAASSRNKIEEAAIKLSRKILSGQMAGNYTGEFCKVFVEMLCTGTPLDPKGTQQEQDEKVFNYEKHEELRRLAREEAKAERIALKSKKPAPQSLA